MFWLFVASLMAIAVVVFLVGFALGWFLWRSYFLAVAPGLVIAIGLWIWLGWLEEPGGDWTRSTLILFFGFWLAVGVVIWALGAALGMVLNLRREPSESPGERAGS